MRINTIPAMPRQITKHCCHSRHKTLALAISGALALGLAPSVGADFPATIELSALDGSNGVKLDGEAAGDGSGFSVSGAGDINGDGIDDLIVSSRGAAPNGNFSGRSYVVFGKASGFTSPLLLSTLDGSTGFKLDGEAAFDQSGISVSGAGDINGDGIDDIVVGAYRAYSNGSNSGRSYVVFGKIGAFASPMQLSALDGTTGFKLDGEAVGDFSGGSVSAAGDINGDGINDLIIGADSADPNGTFSGRSYVVFGKTGGFVSPLQLAALDGSNGFMLDGEAAFDYSGTSVSASGDINGDGIDDLIVGAYRADPNGSASGRSYVVFGKTGGFASPLQLSNLDGINGFKLDGEAAGDHSGRSVSAAGDINSDGIDDLVVGAHRAYTNGSASGRSYVVFGKTGAFASPLQLSALEGSNGFKLDGEAVDDFSGRSVSAAGDINGDGIDDLIVGAFGADPNGFTSGRSYVVFGKVCTFTSPLQLSSLDGTNGFQLNGETERDYSGISVSAVGDVNGDGIVDLIVGANGAGPSGSFSGHSYVVFGQNGEIVFRNGFED